MQVKNKLYEHYFNKADRKELDRLIKAAKKGKEENMKINPRVAGWDTFY